MGELIIRMMAQDEMKDYFRDWWNVFEFVIIVVPFITFVVGWFVVFNKPHRHYGFSRMENIVLFIRQLRFLRLLKVFKPFRVLTDTVRFVFYVVFLISSFICSPSLRVL